MAKGDPNIVGVVHYVVPCDAALETTPTATEVLLAACPDGAGYQLELRRIGFSAVTVPVDGTNVVTVDIEWVDDSAADAVANLKAAYDLEAATARVYNTVWEGSQILDPGDTVNAEFTVTTPDTASEGAGFIVDARILELTSA